MAAYSWPFYTFKSKASQYTIPELLDLQIQARESPDSGLNLDEINSMLLYNLAQRYQNNPPTYSLLTPSYSTTTSESFPSLDLPDPTTVSISPPEDSSGGTIPPLDANISVSTTPQINLWKEIQKIPELHGSLTGLLSGYVDTGYLNQYSKYMTDLFTRNLLEKVFPNIYSEALLKGHYGSSRHGIVETLALSRLNEDLSPALAQMYVQAYENAKQRQLAAASMLTQAILEAARGNQSAALSLADQALGWGKLGLEGSMFNLQTALAAPSLIGNILAAPMNYHTQLLNALQIAPSFEDRSLKEYINMLTPFTGLGQTQFQTVPYFYNPVAGGLSGALSGAMLGNLLGAGSPGLFAGLGGLLGLISDIRLKQNIHPIGNGFYIYQYKNSNRVYIGKIAQEVQKISPENVFECDGYLVIDSKEYIK